jgi:MFS transporter, DHA1 family, tetracycline resistance protein
MPDESPAARPAPSVDVSGLEATEPRPGMPGRAAFGFVFFTVCLDMLALGVTIPVLPKLVVQLEGGSIAEAASAIGVFNFAWAAMQFFFSPVLGALSDRFGRRPVILLSNIGLGLDYVLMAMAPSLSWLFVGRIISGVTSASFPTASAYIADVTPAEKRAAQFGKLGAAFGLGFIIGPALGGLLGSVDLRLPFWAAGSLSLANAVYGAFVLPESLPRERRSKVGWKMANPLGSLRLLRSIKGIGGLAAVSFVSYLAHESLPGVFVLYTAYRYAWSERMVGLSLALVGLTSTIVAAALTGPTVKRFGERRTLLVGLAAGMIGLATFGLAPETAIFFFGLPFTSLWGLAGPAMQALMTKRAGSAQGQLQGALSSMRGITGMIGPLLFTQILTLSIRQGGSMRFPGLAYLVAAGFLVLSILITWLATRRVDSGSA